MRFLQAASVVLLTGAVAACSSAIQQGRGDREVITQEQMRQHNFQTAYDAVEALHGNWLNIRPNTLGPGGPQSDVVVYQDEVRLGGPAQLRQINVRTIDHIQHYDALAATSRWGVGHSQGVIQVLTVP